ncbi:hypothetical protein BH23ACT6_BH23ACT6_24970 [soil metagenome]
MWRRTSIKAVAVTPQLVGSAAILIVIAPLMPEWAQVVTALMLMPVVAIAFGLGEPLACWVLRGTRPPRADEEQALAPAVTQVAASVRWPPDVQIRVLPHAWRVDVGATGRRTLLVTDGLYRALQEQTLSEPAAAALLHHGLGRLAAKTTRYDLAIEAASLPIAGPLRVARWILGRLRALTFGQGVWAARGVIGLLAVAQAGWSGQWPLAAALAVLVVMSYTTVWAKRSWARIDQEIGDEAVIDAGLGPDLADVLGAVGVLTPQRRLRLDRPRAQLRLVDTDANTGSR